MAENLTDKSLPNVRTEVAIPPSEAPTDVDVTEEQRQPVEVTPEDDGGATINFEPGSINVPGTEGHFDNLADILPDDVLDPTGIKLRGDIPIIKCQGRNGSSPTLQDSTYSASSTTTGQNLFKALQVQRIPCSQKRLHSFRR